MRPKFKALSIGWYSVKASIPHNENYVVFFMVLLQKLGCRLAPSDEGAVERSETEGEKSQSIDKSQTVHLSSVFNSRSHNIDSCCVYTAMPQNIRKFCNVFLNVIKSSCKQLSQIMRKHLACYTVRQIPPGIIISGFQIP